MTDTITKILVPLDFGPHGERALRYATTLAQSLSAELDLLHVVENPSVTGAWSTELYAPNVGEILEGLILHAQHQLAALKRSASALGLTVATSVITGQPALAIVDHATQGGFDLIVMGTHGRTGLSHVVMGSVAERVIRKAPCPVLTVHASDTEADGTAPVAA